MSLHKFQFVNNNGPEDGETDYITLTVELDDKNSSRQLESIVGAFVQYLRGMTFTDKSIRKFITHELTE